jgi:hypothetical protein
MPDGITYQQAAAILGSHFSNVAKLIRKGDSTSTGKARRLPEPEIARGLAERRAGELPSE